MAWGNDSSGQLGNGNETNSDVPVPVTGLAGVTAIAAGSDHSLALLSNHTVMAWGSNSSGQLGDGTTARSNVPVAVSGLSGVVAIAAGGEHSLALLENGTVTAWGSNSYGQLGNNSTEPSDVPVPVSGLSAVAAISAGDSHSLALLGNGTVMAWGYNFQGQLGDGTTTDRHVPVAVSGLSGAIAVAGGGFHSLALLRNGTVAAWGANGSGQLGDGSRTGPERCGEITTFPCAKTPAAVSGLGGVTAISAGHEHSLALRGSGSVLAWGGNESGQLGDGTSTGPEPCNTEACSTVPVAVITQGADSGISAGGQHSLAFGPPPPPPTNLPEVGRCVKLATKTGAYRYAGCVVTSAAHKGSYEWLPGPGAKPKFAALIATPQLVTVGGKKVACSTGELSGEWTGAKTAAITTLGFEGCGTQHTKCESHPGGSSISNGNPLAGELGLITGGEKPVAGLDIKAKSPSTELLSFACGQPGEPPAELWAVEGSVIGSIKPVDVMRTEFQLLYTASKGFQSPERFEGGLKDTLFVNRVVEGAPAHEEQAGLTLIGSEKPYILSENEEPLEVKAKP